jgi:hypothetical protein
MRAILGPLDGARIPGGCDHCDAYQTVTPLEAGAWRVCVHHDEWCPWLRQREAKLKGGRP